MRRESNLYKRIGLVLTVVSAVLSFCYAFISYVKASGLAPVYFGIATLVISLILTYVKNGRAIQWFFKLVKRFDRDPLNGIWNIEISYPNEEGNEKNSRRAGHCEFIDTVFGITIKGGVIYDAETKELEVESWVAEHVDVFTLNSEKEKNNYLIYHYNLYSDDTSSSPIKSGFVIAKETNGVYEGEFQDFHVAQGKVVRKGTVKLFIAKRHM